MSAQTTLDEVWIKEEGRDRDFFRGRIQAAVPLSHPTTDNPRGAQKIYEKARSMLLPYGSPYHDVDLSLLLADLDRIFVQEVDATKTNLDYLRILPKIKFLAA